MSIHVYLIFMVIKIQYQIIQVQSCNGRMSNSFVRMEIIQKDQRIRKAFRFDFILLFIYLFVVILKCDKVDFRFIERSYNTISIGSKHTRRKLHKFQ